MSPNRLVSHNGERGRRSGRAHTTQFAGVSLHPSPLDRTCVSLACYSYPEPPRSVARMVVSPMLRMERPGPEPRHVFGGSRNIFLPPIRNRTTWWNVYGV